VSELRFKRTNTILYCKRWKETVAFYQQHLGLPITFSTDWFVEFRLAETVWESLQERGLRPQPLRDHPWGARAFYLFDPEGHRLEIWSPNK
jgi:catechol 2,3-dioxygenase-like lactoylglutathione lyase family enzyme